MDDSTPLAIGAIMGVMPIVRDLANRTLGPLADAIGGDLKSWYEVKRGRNVEATIVRAEMMLRDAGCDERGSDPKRLLGILAGASMEEDPELRERWAALLANAAGGAPDVVHPAFSGILADLSGFDARVLDRVAQGAAHPGEQPHGTARERVALLVGEPDRRRVDLALDNLSRLQLIRVGQHTKWGGVPGMAGPDDLIGTTVFGEQFLDACRPPRPRARM